MNRAILTVDKSLFRPDTKKDCADRRALELLYAECGKCPAVLKSSPAQGTGTATSVTILEQKFEQRFTPGTAGSSQPLGMIVALTAVTCVSTLDHAGFWYLLGSYMLR